jgi:hypothetical protein
MFSLAVDDEHTTLTARTHRSQEELELRPSFLDTHPMQIEAAVNRHKPTAQAAKQIMGHVHASPFDAVSIVGHLETPARFDELAEPRVDGECVGLRSLPRSLSVLRRCRTLDPNLGNATARPVDRGDAGKKTMKIERVVLCPFVRRRAFGRGIRRRLLCRRLGKLISQPT